MVPTLTCGLVRSNFSPSHDENALKLIVEKFWVPMAGIELPTSPPKECSTTLSYMGQ